ncbi:MAG: hypothetical protein ACE5MI_13600, partial [Acidimicrobiia bacterium]
TLYPKLRSVAGHRVTGYTDLAEVDTGLEYLTLMRDPIKACASRFQYKVQISGKKDLVFEDWIQQDWVRNRHTKQISGGDDVNEAIRLIKEKDMFVGLSEYFDESMVLLKGLRVNELDISYKRVNVARNNAIKDRLLSTESTRQLLVEAQQADIQLFDWVKQELFESYRREYGPSLEADVGTYQQSLPGSFNFRNLTLSRLKHYGLYKPVLRLQRRNRTRGTTTLRRAARKWWMQRVRWRL